MLGFLDPDTIGVTMAVSLTGRRKLSHYWKVRTGWRWVLPAQCATMARPHPARRRVALPESGGYWRHQVQPLGLKMRDKTAIREAMWTAMVETRAARARNVHDRIPDFHGSQEAANRLFDLTVWRGARVIKSNPDQPQRPLRQQALQEGKIVYMAVPRLRSEQCFVELDPSILKASPAKTATIAGAFRYGRLVFVEEMQPVDLVISGSVAVNRGGTRVGKGGGFADLEYGLAVAAGIVGPETPVVTTVHQIQVLEEELPWTHHDVPLNYVATPSETIICTGELPRPNGIYWEDLDDEKIGEIPVLQKLRQARDISQQRG